MTNVELTINGEPRQAAVAADLLLVEALRDEFSLTGTKIGCGTGDCGACTVLLNGKAVTSCLIYAVECAGAAIDTVEGLSMTPIGRKVVDGLVQAGAIQCGICTPGFVVASVDLLARTTGPLSREAIVVALAGNLCRCTGYYPILRTLTSLAADTQPTRPAEGSNQ